MAARKKMDGSWWVAPRTLRWGGYVIGLAHFVPKGWNLAMCGAGPHHNFFGKVAPRKDNLPRCKHCEKARKRR